MLIYDIIPPDKIKGFAKEKVLGIRTYKTRGRKYLAFSWRAILVFFIILYFVSGITPLTVLQKSIEAISPDEKTINFYTTNCAGDPAGIPSGSYGASWQNPQNAQGVPDVGPFAELNSFSETNSAVYEGGSLILICQNFQQPENSSQEPVIEEKQGQEEVNPITNETTTTEATTTELTSTSSETTTTNPELPTTFFNQIKNSFRNLKAWAQSEENVFQSAKIKFSFAIGEKEPEILPVEHSTTTTSTTSETLANAEPKIIIRYSLDGELWGQLGTISDYPLSNFLNGGYFSYDAPFLKNWEDIKNLKIKFEGIINKKTDITVFLDSVWIEVNYEQQKKLEEQKEEITLISLKKDFKVDEEPEFEILAKGKKENIVEKLGGAISSVFEEKPKVEAVLIKPQNNEISLEEGKSFSAETHSPTRIKIFKEKDLRPGLHKIKIEYEKNGKVYNFEQEFTWGVLGINVNKSIYLPNEKSFVQMTVLDDQGHTLCDAELLLEIIAPDGKTAMFKTSGWGEGRGEEIEATSTETTSTETTSTETVLEEIALETTSTEATSTETTTTFLEIIPTEATSTETQPETTSTEIQPAEVTSTLEESTSSENFATGTEEISTSSFQTEPENIITETTTETADLADAGRLSTSFLGEIQKSNECGPNSVTYQPDYYTHFMVAGAGKYQLKLTAITKNGTRQIEDSFEVRESVPFDVERIGPTRIFPPSPYQMTLKIKANQDFEGVVKEYVPEGFEITADNLLIYEINRVDESTKVISWNVNWKAGENYELKYQFDAPDISPYLYLLGPLEFTENSSQPTFKEIRQWQIAADAITYQTPGALAYSAAGGTSVAPAYPASIAAGDLLVLIIGMKPSTANSGSVTTPDGWTAITNGSLTGAGGYGTTLGGDTGNTNVFTYYKVAAGTETGSLTVTIATNNVSWAQMYRFSTSLTTMVWSVAGATGTDIVGNTTVSIAMTSDPGVTGGDYIIGAMCIPTDVTTPAQFSAEALSQTGVTFGTVTEISEPDSDIGNDIGGVTYRAPVNSGTSSATSTFTATAGGTVTNVRGPGVFIRIREIPIPSAPTLYNDDGGSNQIAFNNIHTSSTTPIFRLSATHTATFNRFQIEINDNPTFGDAAEHTQNFDSTYSSGTQYNLTISGFSPTNNTTYYVRARASGNGGSNYGNWSTSTWSYTYSTSATTAKWFQTTDAQFDTGTLASTVTDSPNGRVKLSGWLSGWAKRVKLTIDHNDISASLSNFPFLVYLSTSTGRGSDDVSFVFDELGANSKKIAVTKSDGTNQLYVEIEKWNSSTEQAWLWVNATGTDSISSTTDTDFYLYYDSAQADNTTYVGDSGSRPEVWDSNYVMVQHLEETTGTIVDSTGKNNCSNNGMVLDAAGKIDGGDQSATNTANLNCGSDSSLQPTNAITVEAWGKSNDATEDQYTSLGGFSSSGSWTNGYGIFFNSASTINFFVTSYTANVASAPIIPQDWNYVVGTYDKDAGSNQVKIYVNATAGTPDTFSTAITYGGGALTIAQMGGWTTDWLNGYVDEFRISNIARSDSWIKASYETGRDHLLDFGSAEIQENTIMSPAIDYDWLSGAGSWNQFTWIEDEAAGTVSMQLYYKVTTDCDTIVPDAALSGNSTGFASGPVSISSLNTATYNRLCLKATLTKGTGTPYLQDWTVTWAAAGPNLIQNHYRWRNDDGGESTSTWLASEDNATNTYKNTNTRLRFSISNTGSTATDYYYRIEYSEKTATSCENQTSGWSGVPTTTDSNIVTMTTSTYFNNGATTTRQLSTTTGTFVSGKMVASTTNQTFAFTLNQNEYTEHEYLFKFTENATYTTYCFRLTNAGSITDFTYTINAEATISAANQAPTVNSVSLNGGSTIYLIAGSATTVSAVASVSDSQDCSTISTTTAKIYREGVGSGCAASSSNCYIIDFCAQDACVGNNATYTCTTSLQFFADPTDEGNYSQSQGWNTQEWIAWVKVIDNQNASSTGSNEATEEVDVATLLASELSTTTINYGEVKPNETSTEKTVTIKTIGNVPLDVNASGTNMAWNGNNIGVPWQHYSTTTGFSWDTGTPLSTTTQPIELESGKPTQSPTNATDDIYWKLKVPLNTPAGGPYQGTAIFIEIQD
jgi:hypothetical protein